MSDALLLETAAKIFAACTGDEAADRARLRESGLLALMLPESEGGFDGTWQDFGAVAKLAGVHAVAFPAMETILDTTSRANDLHVRAAARAAQIAGALESALDLSVRYTRERKQFGRPLAAFQAIQQQLAVLAEETCAASMAAAAAFKALDRGDAAFECACAKLRANQAAAAGASIAHQVHGAMGFTQEYALQKFTRRLWLWRGEFGNDRHWADAVGAHIAARGPDNFWSDLVARGDAF